jgi:hypothetical protein
MIGGIVIARCNNEEKKSKKKKKRGEYMVGRRVTVR